MFARSLKLVLPILVMMSGEHAKPADQAKIRLAWAVVPSELSPILFAKPGIAKHVGVTYTVDPYLGDPGWPRHWQASGLVPKRNPALTLLYHDVDAIVIRPPASGYVEACAACLFWSWLRSSS